MKKQLPLSTTVFLVLTLFLTGCAALGLEEETSMVPQERINRDEWPTPVPTVAKSSPTPFPKVTLAPAATATPQPPAADASTGSGQTAPLINIDAGELFSAVQDQASSLAGLSPVAVGFVTGDGTSIRQGPGGSYGPATTVDSAELVGIMGQNAGGGWLYVVTITAARGWVPVEALRITGSLAEAPVLPPDPVQAALRQAAPSASGNSAQTGSSAASTSGSRSLSIEDLPPVTTATVNALALNMRQRPGPNYQQLDTLAQDDQVAILALNQDQQWALVETANQKYGWVSIDFLTPDQDLNDAPQVRTLTPAEDYPADQAAPIEGLSGLSQAVAGANSTTAAPEPEPAPPVSTSNDAPTLPSNTLAPVTTARVTTKDDLRRGPGETYGGIAQVTVDEQVTVLAVSQDKNWAVVEGPNRKVGWTPVSQLALDGSLAEAAPVETAWVNSNALTIRSGPGIYYDPVGKLAINTLVSILAIDEGRSWALVETQGGGQGWIQLRLLTLGGSLANVPEISGPPAVQSDPASQALAQAKPATTGQIVLQLASGGEIMAIQADGTGLRRLTHGIDPALSPDGQTVAFTRWQGENGSVWLTNVDGTNERQVLAFIKQPKGPAWSPDGSQIVINFQQGGSLEERSVCKDLTQGGVRPPRNASRVTFSIDDKGDPELCWRMPPDPKWNLRVIDPVDASFEDYDGGTYAFRPTWDPANSWRIVSDGGRGLVQVDLNQNQEQPITDNTGDSSPVFSPDGRYLAVTAGHPGGGQGYDIYRLNADGSGRIRLTQTPLWETALPEEKKAWNNVAPAWSPDGLQIAFLTDRTGGWEIWVMNLDGSNQRPLFPDEINDQLDIEYNFVDERVLSWQ